MRPYGGIQSILAHKYTCYVLFFMVGWALLRPGVGRASNSAPDRPSLPGTKARCEWWHKECCCACVVESCHDNIKRGWGVRPHTSVLIFGKQFAVEINRSLVRYRAPAYFFCALQPSQSTEEPERILVSIFPF